jgi:hypothetical protein
LTKSDPVLSLPQIPKKDAVKVIREIAFSNTERVYVLDHAHMRMLERNITLRQIFKVIRHGDVVDGPEWSTDEEKGWKCVFKRITAGDCIEVVVKLVEREGADSCLVVTAYRCL